MNFDLSKLFPPQKQSGRQTFERLCSFTVLSLMNVTIKQFHIPILPTENYTGMFTKLV